MKEKLEVTAHEQYLATFVSVVNFVFRQLLGEGWPCVEKGFECTLKPEDSRGMIVAYAGYIHPAGWPNNAGIYFHASPNFQFYYKAWLSREPISEKLSQVRFEATVGGFISLKFDRPYPEFFGGEDFQFSILPPS